MGCSEIGLLHFGFREFQGVSVGATEYTLTKDDVGCRLSFIYIPINFEGIRYS